METALQVDLAKPEAPAEQVLGSALGRVSPQAGNVPPSRDSSDSRKKKPQQSTQGASRTTSQIRLKSKDQFTLQTDSDTIPPTVRDSDEGLSYTLQPVDGGFGAWSYVASAFAMYIVVWGEYCRFKHLYSWTVIDCECISQVSLSPFLSFRPIYPRESLRNIPTP